MTLYEKITMTLAAVREERMLITPDPVFFFYHINILLIVIAYTITRTAIYAPT